MGGMWVPFHGKELSIRVFGTISVHVWESGLCDGDASQVSEVGGLGDLGVVIGGSSFKSQIWKVV